MPETPILTMIDQARASGRPPFATDPHADLLERVARAHAQAYWSERVWLTGNISPESLDAICRRLEQIRRSAARTDRRSLNLPDAAA